MKCKAITLALAALSVNAHAAGDGLNPTGTFDVAYRLAGASAVDNLIFDNVLKNICASNISVLNKPDATKTPHALSSYFGIACKAKTTSDEPLIDSAIAGKNVLFLKRSAGGSAYGVNTLLENPPRPVAQIDPATCVAAGTYASTVVGEVDAYSCGNTTTSHVAQDGGIADVNPELFVRENTPAGFSDVNVADLATKFGTVKGVYGNVFGIIVTKTLRDALQAAEFDPALNCVGNETEACMPSLPRQLIASIMRGGSISNWNQLTLSAGPYAGTKLTAVPTVTLPTSTVVKICRRTKGSGTQATINNVILGSPHSSAGTSPAAGNNPNVAEGSGAGDVTKCMTAWNAGSSQTIASDKTPSNYCVNGTGDATTGSCVAGSTPTTAWAIGLMGLERADANFRFIKVDGVAPTAKNAHDGIYTLWSEGVLTQRIDSYAPDATKQAFMNSLRAFVTRASGIKALNDLLVAAGAQPAYVALSTVSGNVPDAVWTANNPVVGFTHGTTDTNNARVPFMNPSHNSKAPLGF
jgi:hypothetical protein